MAADEVRTAALNERFKFAHDAGLDAADVGDNGAALERREHFTDERAHLLERRAKDDQVRSGHGAAKVARGFIDGAKFFALGNAGGAPDEPGDFTGEPA